MIDFTEDDENLPEEVTVIFPENKPESKPRQIVENMNENEETPDESDLLSDRNSRAANPENQAARRSSRAYTKTGQGSPSNVTRK